MSRGRIAWVITPNTGPVSRPASRRNVEAPVISSPAMTACWTGAAPRQAGVFFERRELDRILRLYGRMVAAGEWRDYAIDFLKDRVQFSLPPKLRA